MIIKDKYLKSNFEKIIKSSSTLTEICKKLGLNKTGGGVKTINKYIKLYDIDTSHFNYTSVSNFIKIPLEKILIENSAYASTNHLKNRLYKEGLKERKCEKCGQDENWNGEKMSLILDHINGVNNDDRIENLRILCPNCNATLETHCKGYKKRIHPQYLKRRTEESYICKDCGGHIKFENKTNLCQKCYNIKQRRVIRPSKEQLLKEINELGYCGVGRKYGVSDNSIRKWIK